MIDPDLPLVRPRDPNLLLSPGYRSTFRSLTAEQRWAYNQWLREHSSPAPAGYAYLYVMLLEAALFDEHALAALAELRWLVDEARTASIHEFALFSLACGAWLHRQIETFEWLVEQQTVLTYYINPMLSFQADLQIPLSAQQAINLAPHISYSWNSQPTAPRRGRSGVGRGAGRRRPTVPGRASGPDGPAADGDPSAQPWPRLFGQHL
ncbi:MAG: hypothetical protein HZY76_01655 [Anaerolineae bacterium]|nr:MAG: hypothetical protein HZY76_01655 [Anaerolineae bacterium]